MSFGYQWDMMLAVGESRTIHIYQHVCVLGSIANMNFDGDGVTDIAVYYPAGGFWYILQSTDGIRIEQWGWSDALPTDNQLRINRAFGFK